MNPPNDSPEESTMTRKSREATDEELFPWNDLTDQIELGPRVLGAAWRQNHGGESGDRAGEITAEARAAGSRGRNRAARAAGRAHRSR